MDDEAEMIAEFSDPVEAESARQRLAADGIEAHVQTPDVTSSTALYLVLVRGDDVSRALKLLGGGAGEVEEGWETLAEQAIDGWLCHGCDTPVPADLDECPECGARRADQPPPAASADDADDEDEQE